MSEGKFTLSEKFVQNKLRKLFYRSDCYVIVLKRTFLWGKLFTLFFQLLAICFLLTNFFIQQKLQNINTTYKDNLIENSYVTL